VPNCAHCAPQLRASRLPRCSLPLSAHTASVSAPTLAALTQPTHLWCLVLPMAGPLDASSPRSSELDDGERRVEDGGSVRSIRTGESACRFLWLHFEVDLAWSVSRLELWAVVRHMRALPRDCPCVRRCADCLILARRLTPLLASGTPEVCGTWFSLRPRSSCLRRAALPRRHRARRSRLPVPGGF
jgi:hypothetical protein